MSGSNFPPAANTTVQAIIPQYLYEQYYDDEDLQAFVYAFNQLAQSRLNWINTIGLPIYTGSLIAGPLLDIVAEGLYGISRPALPTGTIVALGLLDTFMLNQVMLNSYTVTGSISYFVTTDDVFKRIITWHFFKGDGKYFCIPWLKRRIMRFLIGTAGTSPNIDNTYPVSITFGENADVTITITLTSSAGITLMNAQLFQSAVAAGVVELPFQFNFTVAIVDNIGAPGLANDGGWLQVTNTTGWPTNHNGFPGTVWNNGGIVTVIPGVTPNPAAAPQFYGLITSAQLLTLGGGNLPLSNPGVGTGQLWNNGGVVEIA